MLATRDVVGVTGTVNATFEAVRNDREAFVMLAIELLPYSAGCVVGLEGSERCSKHRWLNSEQVHVIDWKATTALPPFTRVQKY